MRNLQYYKRILAGIACATVLMSNLGVNSQVVFAAEGDEVVTESAVAETVSQDEPDETPGNDSTPEEEVSTQEDEAEVPAVEESAEEPVAEEPRTEEPVIIEEGGSAGSEESGSSEEAGSESTEETKSEESAEAGSTEEGKTEDGSTDTDPTEEGDKADEAKETETVDETKELICKEDHEHTEACYKTKDAATEETTEDTEEDSKDEHDELWYYIHELDCKEDHKHTDDCYKTIRKLHCDKDHEHTKDCYPLISEITYIEEDGDAEARTITYEASTSGIKVKAEAKEGTLPEGAALKAHRIQSEHDLQKVSEELDKSDVNYDDYLALDVYFVNSDGDEIEPDGAVKVSFEFEESERMNDIVENSVSVQHFDESGNKTDVVTVADTTSNSDTGSVEVKNADKTDVATTVKAEFEVESFSTFTITWNYSNGYWNDSTSMNVSCYDSDGNSISDKPNGVTTRGLSLNNNEELTLSSSKLEIDGYTLDSMTLTITYKWYGNYQTTYNNVTSIKANFKQGYVWDYTVTYDNGKTATFNSYDQSSINLRLTYKKGETSNLTNAYFFIVVNGQRPSSSETDTDTGKYSDELGPIKDIKELGTKWDANEGGTVTEDKDSNGNLRSYVNNEIVQNLQNPEANLPTNADIVNTLMTGDKTKNNLGYKVELNPEDQIYVTSVDENASIDWKIPGIAEGNVLYMHWYVQKKEQDNQRNDKWHIDGELMIMDSDLLYDANTEDDVTSMPADKESITSNSTVTVDPENLTPVREGYTFVGWNTKADGTGTSYQIGDTFEIRHTTTLYAQWEENKGGSLKVSKTFTADSTKGFIPEGTKYDINVTVDGVEATKEYTATIYKTDGDTKVEEKKFYFDNSKATIQLEDGQYFVIEDLPDGADYKVEETVPDGYKVTYSNNTGKIVKNETQEVGVTNAYRVVKTGVDLGEHPVEAAAAMAAVMIVFGAAYVNMKRRYR